MISKENMQTVLDVVEAVCLLSNLYKERGITNRSTSVYVTGGEYPLIHLLTGKFTDDNGTYIISENVEVLLDEAHKFGSTFEQLTAALKKEMERVENG